MTFKTWGAYKEKAALTQTVEHDAEYLAVALAGEVGELLNVVKKTMRGDFTLLEKRDKVIEELGGILWYAAMFDRNILNHAAYDPSREMNSWKKLTVKKSNLVHLSTVIFGCAAQILIKIENQEMTPGWREKELITEIVEVVMEFAHCVDSSLLEVAQSNILLLEKRSAAGTIKGHERKE